MKMSPQESENQGLTGQSVLPNSLPKTHVLASENISQIVVLAPLFETVRKLSIVDTFPKYAFFSDSHELQSISFRNMLDTMLTVLNREKARDDFIELCQLSAENIEKLNQFGKEYPMIRKNDDVTQLLKKMQFFKNVLLKGLKNFTRVGQLAYLRLPFSDIFQTIEEKFEFDMKEKKFQQSIICYCSQRMRQNQIRKTFKQKVDFFIEFQGFLFCEMSKENVLNQSILEKKTIYKIIIPPARTNQKCTSGFMIYDDQNEQTQNKTIIFNPLNVFKISSVQIKTFPYEIVLQYQWDGFKNTEQVPEVEEEVELRSLKTKSIPRSPGELMVKNEQFQSAQVWYREKLNKKGIDLSKQEKIILNPENQEENNEIYQYKLILQQLIENSWKKQDYKKVISYTTAYEKACQAIYQNKPSQLNEQIKRIRDNNISNIRNISIPFTPYRTELNYCTYFMKNGEYYMSCRDCSASSGICYCLDCWDEDLHRDHNYRKVAVYYEGHAYCDCGRDYRLSTFCKNHSKKRHEFPTQNKKKFVQFYLKLYEVYFLLKKKEIHTELLQAFSEKIIKSLDTLTSKNGQYVRYTIELFQNTIQIESQKIYIFEKLVQENKYQWLIWNLAQDHQSKKKLASLVIRKKNQDQHNRFYMSSNMLADDLFSDDEMIIELALQDSIFINRDGTRYLKYSRKYDQAKEIFNVYINYLYGKTEKQFVQWLNFCLTDQNMSLNKDSCLKAIIKMIKYITKQEKPHINALLFLTSLILSFCQGNISEAERILPHLKKQKVNDFYYNRALEVLMEHYPEMVLKCRQDYRGKLLIPLYLAQKSKEKSKLFEVLNSVLFTQRRKLEIIDILYVIICMILNQKTILLWSNKNQNSQKREKELESWFKSYLYEKQQVRKVQIWHMKKNGRLKFKNAGFILNDLCDFSESKDRWMYNSIEKYPNPSIKFDHEYEIGNKKDLLKLKMPLQQMSQLSKLQEQLFTSIFLDKDLYQKLDKIWSKMEETFEGNALGNLHMKRSENGQVYVILLIIIDKIVKGKNNEIRQTLENIEKDKESQKRFCNYSEFRSFDHLFSGEAKKEEKMQQIEENNIKSLAEKKKSNLLNKFKESQQLVLKKNMSKISVCEENEEKQQCLVCHQGEKQSNKFVYMVSMNKNKTISSSIHLQQNKSRILFSTCFHKIHVDCYIKMQKQRGITFSCPLCSRRANCILPASTQENSISIKICENTINTVLIVFHKDYNFENCFIFLLKHLVEAVGLHAILSLEVYSILKEKNKKLNQYILNILMEIYKKSSEDEKAQFQENIHEFLQEVKLCSPGYLELQTLLIQAIKSKISDGQVIVDEEMYKSLNHILYPEQLKIFNESLLQINGFEVDLPLLEQEMKEDDSHKKRLSFKLRKLPQYSSEFQLFNKLECTNCGKLQQQRICMLCNCVYCERCQNKKSHIRDHYGNWLAFIPENGTILFENRTKSEEISIYFDEFRRPYFEKEGEQVFRLNQNLVQKIVSEFLNLI